MGQNKHLTEPETTHEVRRRFRELIDSIYFAFGTRKDAACKRSNFREFVNYMHLARFASSVYRRFKCHCPFRGFLFIVNFIFFSLNNTNLL